MSAELELTSSPSVPQTATMAKTHSRHHAHTHSCSLIVHPFARAPLSAHDFNLARSGRALNWNLLLPALPRARGRSGHPATCSQFVAACAGHHDQRPRIDSSTLQRHAAVSLVVVHPSQQQRPLLANDAPLPAHTPPRHRPRPPRVLPGSRPRSTRRLASAGESVNVRGVVPVRPSTLQVSSPCFDVRTSCRLGLTLSFLVVLLAPPSLSATPALPATLPPMILRSPTTLNARATRMGRPKTGQSRCQRPIPPPPLLPLRYLHALTRRTICMFCYPGSAPTRMLVATGSRTGTCR